MSELHWYCMEIQFPYSHQSEYKPFWHFVEALTAADAVTQAKAQYRSGVVTSIRPANAREAAKAAERRNERRQCGALGYDIILVFDTEDMQACRPQEATQ